MTMNIITVKEEICVPILTSVSYYCVPAFLDIVAYTEYIPCTYNLLYVCLFVCGEQDTFLFVSAHLGAGVHQQAIQRGLCKGQRNV